MVQASNSSGGMIFHTQPDQPWDQLGQPVQCVIGFFPGVKWLGHGVDNQPHLQPRLKKEYSYTSTLPLDLNGLLLSELYFILLYFNFTNNGN
jgi:hypothetical protein